MCIIMQELNEEKIAVVHALHLSIKYRKEQAVALKHTDTIKTWHIF